MSEVFEIEAAKAVENFFEAFNAHDGEAYLKTLHFPHIRINGAGRVNIVQNPSDIRPLKDVLAFLAEKEGWSRSTLDSREVVHAAEHKVHFNIQFSRYRSDGSKYAVHKSLWIVTSKDGRWGVQARSSYAP
jgi:hypothetical protein